MCRVYVRHFIKSLRDGRKAKVPGLACLCSKRIPHLAEKNKVRLLILNRELLVKQQKRPTCSLSQGISGSESLRGVQYVGATL